MKDIGPSRYDHTTVEKRWQECWEKSGLDKTDISSGKRPFYNLMMFPYPSAEGLHVGNMYAFTGSDIYGRFKRMQGYTVFEPIGLDGFGIHSENYSLKIGKHPMDHAKVTEKRFYGQLRQIGAMFDFSRTLNTYDPSYYRWTQWLFIQLFNRGLAYRGKASVNFCPSCKTVLADEQVLVQTREGVSTHVCERCGNEVEKRSLEQWFFKITAYAGKLLEDIPSLNWSDKVKVAQTNWIGKKQGISITYPVVTGSDKRIGEVTCFTTRPDTNFGATFVVLSPEHEFVKILLSADGLIAPEKKQEIEAYCRNASRKSEQDRMAEGRKKTGVDTGLYCLNQLNNKKLPLYISDFVLSGFGTGAVVGVPGHDVRDFQFAKEFRVPIVRVVVGTDGSRLPITEESQVQEDEGVMMDSGFLDGMDIHAATEAMMEYLEGKGWGKRTVTYHLRDWLISRQRYWGPPIPMIFCQACFDANKGQRPDMPGWYPVPEEQLPLVLPRIDDYKPSSDGIAPLSKHKEFFDTVCPSCGGHAVRETDVSDTFLDSSWYFLRYPCISSVSADSKPFDPGILRRWLPVHMYTGGAEHSVLHLLYSRYITMALSDMGYLEFQEPFTGFFAHGLIIKDGAKMSKSKGNIVNPDEYIAKYGADAVRLYLMFIGPFSLGGDFRDTGMEGMARWVNRVWKLLTGATSEEATSPASICVLMEKTIAKVTEDMEKRRYNTAIASLMEFTNAVADAGGALGKEEARKLILLIAPLAPHMAEELWSRLHGRGTYTNPTDSVHTQSWPSYDPTVLEKEDVSVIVQINGKLRDTLVMGTEAASRQDTVEERAKQSDRVRTYLFPADHPGGVSIVKVIFVPGKLINFVTG